MLKQQVISVTDLRKKTKECLEGLHENPKFIFMNNKMVGVLLDVDEYETLTKPDLFEISEEELGAEIRKKASAARKTPKEELLNI